jgi:hypothetical protein
MSEPYQIHLDQQPCVVKYVEKWSCFLVGTYKLLPTIQDARAAWPNITHNYELLFDRYSSVNHRIGSLVLLSKEKGSNRFSISGTVNCSQGGVFDMTIRGGGVYVAHANNTISYYELTINGEPDTGDELISIGGDNKLSELAFIKLTPDSSILLTSIDTCSLKNPNGTNGTFYTVVGDSKARVSILCGQTGGSVIGKLGRVFDKIWISEKDDPVWQVRFVQPAATETTSTVEQLYLIVTSENRSWCVLGFNIKSQRLYNLMVKNRDFGAGVTSLCIMAPPERLQTNYDEQHLDVILGSYDETLRKYQVRLSKSSDPLVAADCIETASIAGGGIWRVIQKDQNLYIAAMYAGCYKAASANISSTLVNLTTDLVRPAKVTDNGSLPSLDYDIDVSETHDVACAVDFNGQLCLFFKP